MDPISSHNTRQVQSARAANRATTDRPLPLPASKPASCYISTSRRVAAVVVRMVSSIMSYASPTCTETVLLATNVLKLLANGAPV